MFASSSPERAIGFTKLTHDANQHMPRYIMMPQASEAVTPQLILLQLGIRSVASTLVTLLFRNLGIPQSHGA